MNVIGAAPFSLVDVGLELVTYIAASAAAALVMLVALWAVRLIVSCFRGVAGGDGAREHRAQMESMGFDEDEIAENPYRR